MKISGKYLILEAKVNKLEKLIKKLAIGIRDLSGPEEKFQPGDFVIDTSVDYPRVGEVEFYGDFDKELGSYRLKVRSPDGSRKFWNENNLEKITQEEYMDFAQEELYPDWEQFRRE